MLPSPTPAKKRKKKAKKAKVPATDGGESTKYDPTSELKAESWKEDWGRDKLAPLPIAARKSELAVSAEGREAAPHTSSQTLVPYWRRVEGLLADSKIENALTDLEPISEQQPIARLSHGLDRVLFNPGVHWLQDPRSHVYNFTPWLEKIPKVNDFAFERLTGFIKSSKDDDLYTLAKRENRTFAGSTSSLTKILSHIYFLISGDKHVDTSNLSAAFQSEAKSFTPGQRMPATVILNYRDGVYAIDSDSDSPEATDRNVLTWMGTLLEKFLTTSPQEFKTHLRSTISDPEVNSKREAYRYAKSNSFVTRSQLDCQDPRLPGTGVFDIKTRAALPIRMDVLNYEENSGYLIRTLQGPLESFEREYYDLIRSAFLKYSFQARIGNMDGVLVAYHNTARLFGFQYVPLEEMDERLFGSPEVGKRVFQKCLALLEIVADEVIRTYPKQSLKCTFETLEGKGRMDIWVQPLDADDSAESQKTAPMKQIQVTATNYLDELRTRGPKAVEAPKDSDWSIYWTISTLADNQPDILKRYQAAKDRQYRDFLLPSGATLENIEELWDKLNFRKATAPSTLDSTSPVASPDAVVSTTSDSVPEQDGGGVASPTINPDNFRSPDKRIEFLRSVARSGREHTEAVADQRKGMPRLVWGEGEPWVDEHGVFDEPAEQTEIVTSEAISSTEVASETLEALPEALSDGVVGDVARMADADADISHDISAVEKVDMDMPQFPLTDHTVLDSHGGQQDETGSAPAKDVRGVPGSDTHATSL
ncbi:Pet127-domain-containing protein [Pleurotus eryngii]|uniref:Pet127-domain-containing protein n=1 Tax=Pleurotus eryngii TaxID=5323 RepID=A0A9P6A4N1_PLEER|nr:Pet127-domain-containing protein [Pleurotus eryngii]